MATNLVQIDSRNDEEIRQRLEAERARLRKIAGLDQPTHFHRPIDRPSKPRNVTTSQFSSGDLPGSMKI